MVDPTRKAIGAPALVGSRADLLTQTPTELIKKIESKKILLKSLRASRSLETYQTEHGRLTLAIANYEKVLADSREKLARLEAAFLDNDGETAKVDAEIAQLEAKLKIAEQLSQLTRLFNQQKELAKLADIAGIPPAE